LVPVRRRRGARRDPARHLPADGIRPRRLGRLRPGRRASRGRRRSWPGPGEPVPGGLPGSRPAVGAVDRGRDGRRAHRRRARRVDGGLLRLAAREGPPHRGGPPPRIRLRGRRDGGLCEPRRQGCTSGVALSGGAVLAPGAWAFLVMFLAGGFVTAWIVRRAWR